MKPGIPGHMEERGQRIAWLVAGFIRNTLTEAEHDELDDWINESDENMQLFEDWTDDDNLQANLEWMDKVNAVESFRVMQSRGAFKTTQKTWIWSAACIILLILSAVLIFRSKSGPVKNQSVLTANTESSRPGIYRASLEIGNNYLIDLETIPVGQLTKGIKKNKDGMIAYSSSNTSAELNTLRTPLSAQYEVHLIDGTGIWLNASSKLSYVPSFNDSIRLMQLIGEAYFEVAKDSLKPFIVQLSPNRTVKVLGTHFNVMNYPYDSITKISLTEGSLLVTAGKDQLTLSAGEEATISMKGIIKNKIEDSSKVAGWKNGYFYFNNANLKEIMLQIEHWYGVKAAYKTTLDLNFTGTVIRNQPIESLLSLIEKDSKVKFTIDDKLIYIDSK